MNKQNLIDMLRPLGQQHLVQFWDELTDTQKQSLIDDINRLDLAELNRVFTKSTRCEPCKQQSSDDMQPVPNDLKG